MAEDLEIIDSQLKEVHDFFSKIYFEKKEKAIFRDFFRFLECRKNEPFIQEYLDELLSRKEQCACDARFLLFCELINLKLQLNLYNSENNTELIQDLKTSTNKKKLDEFVQDETNNEKLSNIIVDIQLKEIKETFFDTITDEEDKEIAEEFIKFLDSNKHQAFIQDFISQLWTHKNSCAKSGRFLMDCELINLKRAANKYCLDVRRRLMRDLEFIISPYTLEEEE
jgi:hypothetical protein